MQYAQAIKGRATRRGTGIIDTIHLVEVSRAAQLLDPPPEVRQWFGDYAKWMATQTYGIAERDAKNNHCTCWVMKVAAFAMLTGNSELTEYCRNRFKSVVDPGTDGARRQLPARDKAGQAVWLLALQSRCHGGHCADPFDALGESMDFALPDQSS